MPAPSSRRWPTLAAALLLLDVALTFQNVWPTPFVYWTGGVSVELGVCLIALWIIAHWRSRVPAWILSLLGAIGVVLMLGRYAVVTAPALFGRDVNLYWDLRFVPDVAAMLLQPASWWMTIAAVAGIVLVPTAIFLGLRWALKVVGAALAEPARRRVVGFVGLAMVALFAAQRASIKDDEWQDWADHRLWGTLDFPPPVSVTYARQFRILAKQLAGDAASLVGPSPDLSATLDGIGGADVFVFFVESYGAVAYDRPEFRETLAADRARLAETVAASGRHVVSGFVESPTFGGGSWLAHISLLSGIDVRDEDTNQILLTQERDTLVQTFARRGYRTVAVMPGLQRDWPEGGFYRFDRIYPEEALEYKGPQFGWWDVPDQYSLAKLDALELNRTGRAPVFAFMAGVSTHTPFSPTAPFQPDWQKLMTPTPYTTEAMYDAFEHVPDWLNLGPSYVRALQYVYASVGSYVQRQGARDSVIVILGDHQPPAMVSGQGASWDVPVHIISNRRDVLDRLKRHGFSDGVEPARASLTRMNGLTPWLLEAFSETVATGTH